MKSEDGLKDNVITSSKISIQVPEGEERKKGAEAYLNK